jgi:hypothetical protein
MLDVEPCEAFKEMCKVHEKRWTCYAQGSEKDQQEMETSKKI